MIMDFFGNDNMSLDISGQVRKLHGCMTENFHPVSQALGIGMTLPCGHFYFFCDILGVEMWDRVRNVDSELESHFAYLEAAVATNGRAYLQ